MIKLRTILGTKEIIDGYDQGKTTVFGFLAALANLVFGIVIIGFARPFIVHKGFLIGLLPFVVSLILLLSAWLAWRGRVKLAFDLFLFVFLLEMLIYALTTVGFGLVIGVTIFIFLSIMTVEIAPLSRVNRTLLVTGIFATLIFLLDFYGPTSRFKASGILPSFLPLLIVLEVGIYLIVLARQYRRLNLVSKLIIPVVSILYTSVGALAAFNYSTNANIVNEVNREWQSSGFDQSKQILLNLLEFQVRSNALFSVLVLIVITLATFGILRLITNPIRELTIMAQKVTLGKLNVHIDISSKDEIGTLAQAFNLITSQLRQIVGTLEQRVDERTRELYLASQKALTRAQDLKILVEINKLISSVRHLEQLLPLITQLISEKFGYYYVGVFLLDTQREYAVLQAANGEVGLKMVEQGYRVEVDDRSPVGFVAKQGQPKLALDTGDDAVVLKIPDLPQTRSEVTLPLKVNETVIGVLDLHSNQPSAFKEEDVEFLSILADQVANAIDNARLFDETLGKLAELQSLQPGYIKDEWSRYISESKKMGYRYKSGSISPLEMQTMKSNVPSWESLEKDGFYVIQPSATSSTLDTVPMSRKKDNLPPPLLAVPILLRGEIIGLIQLEEIDPKRVWTDDEISLVRSVADQVGLALENARLLEQTQRRAEREALVTQITGRLRASNDPNEILQTAVMELQHVLRVKTARIVLPEPDLNIQPETESSRSDTKVA